MGGWPVTAALAAMIATGVLVGLVNGFCVTRLRMAPFIVTLAMLFVVRGAGLWITETRAVNLPDTFRQLATARLFGVPSPVVILVTVLFVAEFVLRRTALGRQIYAVGNDAGAAEKAGVRAAGILRRVYMISAHARCWEV